MRTGKYMVPLLIGIAVVLGAASSADASCWTYYSLTDPGNAEPPAAPWKLTAGATDNPPAMGETLWLAKKNTYKLNWVKTWTITGVAGYGKMDSTGYISAGPPAVSFPGVTTAIDPVNGTIMITLGPPQPKWEVVRLVRIGAVGPINGILSRSLCVQVLRSDKVMTMAGAFGVIGQDFVDIRKIAVYPITGEIGLIGNQDFIASNGGVWSKSLSAIDPNGLVRPGVLFEYQSGESLGPEDGYSLTLEQVGSAVADYDVFALDMHEDVVNGDWWEFPTKVTYPIPAASEWGLIVLALLIFTAGTIALGRKRQPAIG